MVHLPRLRFAALSVRDIRAVMDLRVEARDHWI